MLPLHLFACPSCQSEEMQVLRDSSTACLRGICNLLSYQKSCADGIFQNRKAGYLPWPKICGWLHLLYWEG